MKIFSKHIPGFGYVVEKDGKHIATRRYNPNDASSVISARNQIEDLRDGLIKNPARISLISK